MRLRALALPFALALALANRGARAQPLDPAPGAAPPSPPAAALAAGSRFEGLASWYGGDFHGRLTASGEVYDKEGLSAAHRSLPFGTLLRVTSLDTGASVVVRVNDRGPFVGERILDLSEAAARLIGLVVTGTARVSCLVLPPEEAAAFGSPGPRPPAPGPSAGAASGGAAAAGVWAPGTAGSGAGASASAAASPGAATSCRIQVASYREAANAAATLERLRLAGLSPSLESAGGYNRVVFPDVPAAEAEALAARLRSLGYRELLITWTRPAGR